MNKKKVLIAMSPKQSLRLATGQAGGARNKRVLVAMSGGVDSSVAAALLKKENFDVVGVFMKFWQSSGEQENRCCSSESEKRARLVAEKLGIPFYVINFEKEFKKQVVDYFLKEQKAGLTPNPCVVCNKEIKFGLLFEKLKQMDADYIATGHYARLRREIQNPKLQTPKYKLLKAKDKNKDQSYFLWGLNQKILKQTLFPVGNYKKEEIKKLAKKFRLPVLNILESMEVCFIQNTTTDFLKKYLKLKPGKIINTNKDIVGDHQGTWFYTTGQRKGIGLAGGPYYVLKKDPKKNIVIVTKNEKDLYQNKSKFKNANWILGKKPKIPIELTAKIRYQSSSAKCVLKNNNVVIFDKPQKAITPGQSIVFYQKEELLGGGIIKV